MRRFLLPLLLTTSLILAACSASSSDQTPPEPAPVSTEVSSPSNPSITIIDSQGSVTVEATPLNLDAPADTLEFDVVLDTHSVDLSMDLAVLATLTTDTGITVQATLWDAPRGGHHVTGKLIFPALKDGKSILEGAGKLTLTITDVDVPSRIFEWELQ
ncbi:MAG: hypothetical protein HND47_11910 [Chloroflexi bacterium]|nr:hypothetical protein [Chloroflexota bacterium]